MANGHEFFSELPPLPSGDRPGASFGVRQLVEYLLLPLLSALLAWAVYRSFERMLWPPPPTILVAGAITFLLERNGNLATAAGRAVASTICALLATWALGVFVALLQVIDCVGPGGGCFPW